MSISVDAKSLKLPHTDKLKVDAGMKPPPGVTVHFIVTEHGVGTYTARLDYPVFDEDGEQINPDAINMFECALEYMEGFAKAKVEQHLL